MRDFNSNNLTDDNYDFDAYVACLYCQQMEEEHGWFYGGSVTWLLWY